MQQVNPYSTYEQTVPAYKSQYTSTQTTGMQPFFNQPIRHVIYAHPRSAPVSNDAHVDNAYPWASVDHQRVGMANEVVYDQCPPPHSHTPPQAHEPVKNEYPQVYFHNPNMAYPQAKEIGDNAQRDMYRSATYTSEDIRAPVIGRYNAAGSRSVLEGSIPLYTVRGDEQIRGESNTVTMCVCLNH